MKNRNSPARITALALLALLPSALLAEPVMQTEDWANKEDAFAQFTQRIASMNGRNLLSRTTAKMACSDLGMDAQLSLIDGAAGERCEEGRVMVGGAPTVINCYLGTVKTIKEVGVFTFNGDARANQDYEVRFADNSRSPGVEPSFGSKPDLTTGAVILGKDGGGFHTSFREKSGGDLAAKADWVQFRIWRTYGAKAGQPSHNPGATSASAVIELEVLGAESDVVVIPKELIELRQKIRDAPANPVWENKATWRETYLGARKALLEWECMQDEVALANGNVAFGEWYVAGPVDAKTASEVERFKTIEFDKPLKLKNGELVWTKRGDIANGKLVDFSDLKVKPGESLLLCRRVQVVGITGAASNRFGVGLGMSGGTLRFLPTGPSMQVATDCPVAPNGVFWDIKTLPPAQQLFVRLNVGPDGRCAMWFQPEPGTTRPGAGDSNQRISRREALFERLNKEFTDPLARTQMGWEVADSIWTKFDRLAMAGIRKYHTDWAGDDIWFLADQYKAAIERRLATLDTDLAVEPPPVQAKVRAWAEKFKSTLADKKDAAALFKEYSALCGVQEAVAESHRIDSIRLAVEDQLKTFKDRYPKAGEYLIRVDALAKRLDTAWTGVLGSGGGGLTEVLAVRADADTASKEILLANPLLNFEKLLLVSGGPGFNSNWGGPNRLGGEIVTLSPVSPEGKLTSIYKGGISDLDLNWDGKRLLFSDGRVIREMNVDGTGGRVISTPPAPLSNYDGCYLPDGKIMFVSTACEQAVPCTGGADVGNIHVMDADGKNERRLTYDQDHDWNPVVLHNGRVLYTRWEYEDTPHYFTRLLFHMNPDGSGQSEFYGSNSYWPNAMYWPRPIPGEPTAVSCVVSGHHGVGRMGELVILDPSLGRFEADGVIQRIPGRGKKVEPVIKDGLVSESWPRFAAPWPLGDEESGLGGGKYFLTACKMTPQAQWGIYLVDIFDNMTPILMGSYCTPIPLRPRPMPPVIPSKVDLERKDALVYMVNVYEGGGLKGFPRGSVKSLRVGSYNYRYPGNGDTYASSMEGGWDVKKIFGTVPVYEDGSAYFSVPANTPIFVQPVDGEGKAQQLMRSWFVAMPGEILSCVGCHEKQNSTPSMASTLASKHGPVKIKPWNGPVRGFSFDRDVQPVLDRRCAGCHKVGAKSEDGSKSILDLTAKQLHPGYDGKYSPSYLALHPYVRRAGYEADYHLPVPAEYEADTSPLVQLLKKGHKNVQLTAEEWDRLYTWIDLNLPYPATWGESHRPPAQELVDRRAKYKKEYAFIDEAEEQAPPPPKVVKFEPPPAAAAPSEPPPALDNWPLTEAQAQTAQKVPNLSPLTLDLGTGVTMPMAAIPAGKFVMGDPAGLPNERPCAAVSIDNAFYLGVMEVTNQQYACFDPEHDSGYIDGRGKDRIDRGFPVNDPEQPVVRITWEQAMEFCRWLSQRTGKTCTLPTEAQWEYACRAGTATPYGFGEKLPLRNDLANFADNSLSGWGWGRIEQGYSDKAKFSDTPGKYKPNAWGLFDMHGNVAEWCLSSYRPYPYRDQEGRDDATPTGLKVVRGGSWNDVFQHGKSASRWRYSAYQPVYNVGFRVLVKAK